MEQFVVMWLLEIIGEKLDFRQYGGMKGNSVSHYLFELINLILFNQDIGVPSWLLKMSFPFFKHRTMVVRYKGQTSNVKNLDALLGLFLFLVLINDVGFNDQ